MKTDNTEKKENEKKKVSFVKRFRLIPKIICLLAAFIIWIYVMEVDSPDYEATFEDVPVTVVGLSDLDTNNLSVFSGQDTLVDVTVKGQKSVIAKNSVSDISVTADVSQIKDAGSYDVTLSFDMPSGLTFSESSVTELKLFIDRRTSVNLDLKPKISSYQVPSGYELGDITCDTASVTVTGAETVLKNISYALADANMADKNLTESFTTDSNITLCDSADNPVESKYIKLSQMTAKVTVPVYTSKEVKLTAVGKNGFYNDNFANITVEPKTIKVKGDKSVIDSLEEISVTSIDEKSIREDTKLSVDITLPDGVYPVTGEPTTADVNVKFRNMLKRSVTIKNVNVKNADDLKYEVMSTSTAVEFMGEADAIKSLDAANLSLTVDLKGYEKGSNPGMIYPAAEVGITNVDGTVYELGTYNIQILIG